MANILRGTRRSRYCAMISCKSGASAAEFAVVLPLLLLLLLGMMQMSMLLYSYNVMVLAAGTAARAMAVCTITTESEAKAYVQTNGNLPPWVASTAWSIVPKIGTGPSGSDVSVAISVDPRKAAILSYVPFPVGMLQTMITMRKEPLAFGGGIC